MPLRAKMSLIWAGIEDLLKSNLSEKGIKFGSRSRGAMLLGRSDEEIEILFKQIGNLYDKRSAATHGRKFTYTTGLNIDHKDKRLHTDLLSLRSSYQLLCEILIRIIDQGSLISEADLLNLEKQYSDRFNEEE
jgi:hypothetical protein